MTGRILRMSSFERMGLPALRKESASPPMPINAPPTPTRENNGLSRPGWRGRWAAGKSSCLRCRGDGKHDGGSLPWHGEGRVKVTARKPTMAKIRYGVRSEARCCQTSPVARLRGIIVETMTTAGESKTSNPQDDEQNPCHEQNAKADGVGDDGTVEKPSMPDEI